MNPDSGGCSDDGSKAEAPPVANSQLPSLLSNGGKKVLGREWLFSLE